MTMTETRPATNNVSTIAKFFGLAGKAAVEAMRGLTAEEKIELAEGIRNETFTY